MNAWRPIAWLHRQLAGSLRRQLVTGVVLVHSLLMAGFLWDITQHQQQILLARLSEQATALARGLASTSAGSLVSRDLAMLRELVATQAGQPDLSYAFIADAQGRVLAHTDAARIGWVVADLPMGSEPQLLSRSIELVDAVYPVRGSGSADRPAGWVRVGMAPQAKTRASFDGIVRDGLAYALAAVLVGAGLAWLMARRVTRRLAHIQDVADAVDRGLPERRACLEGDDEAAHLARSFNRMVQGVVSARDALAESERRLRLALDAAAMVPWRWNTADNRIEWSDDCEQLLGPGAAAGSPPLIDRVLDADHAELAAAWRAARRDPAGRYHTQFRLRRTDGAIRWLQAQGRVEHDAQGRAVGLLGVCQDITEAKLAEQRLHASEARARQIIESSPDALLVIDNQGCILQANRRVTPLFGYQPHQLLGGQVAQLWEGCAWPQWVAGAAPPGTLECVGRRRSGGRFHAQLSLARLPDTDPPQTIVAVRDETESRALKSELIRHRDHLEEVVAHRTVELDQARQVAERLARVKTEFLAHMSHEIRTPLNAVLGLAQLGRSCAGQADDRASFASIHDAGQQLLHVVNDILDYSRLDAGKVALEQAPFDLKALLNSVLQLAHGLAVQKGLGLVSQFAPDLPAWVLGDAHRLRQVLGNLLGNAIKFTELGRVCLVAERAPGADGLVFRVEDTGIGMNPDQVARLFKPFEQGDTSTTRRFGGSGLGLVICHDLVALMQGAIDVQTSPGQGSRFTVTLPLCERPAPLELPATRPEPHSGPRLAGLRVLAAEDVEVNRLVLEAILSHEGAEIVFAQDGEQAVEALRAAGPEYFDVVLMDVQMPVMDGYEATRALHRLAPQLPVIGLTAHALQDDRDRCLACGMVAHTSKPVDVQALVALLKRHVPNRDAIVA